MQHTNNNKKIMGGTVSDGYRRNYQKVAERNNETYIMQNVGELTTMGDLGEG